MRYTSTHILLGVSTLCIIGAFFLGYTFAYIYWKEDIEKQKDTVIEVHIETKKEEIEIKSSHENIRFIIDGKQNEDDIILKK